MTDIVVAKATRIVVLALVTWFCCPVEPRAIMVEPPHRSSLWRFYNNTSMNLRDDSLNCGGYDWQWGVNGGRCGVCGDRWNGTQDHADNGRFDTGIIVRSYMDGHYINVTFEVSSNYLGYVEFRLCPRNSTKYPLEQSCFDRYPLWIDESHGTRYYLGSRGGIYDIHIRLPSGLICKRCVLQWKYKTGYRYNGEEQCKCLGCGQQEQYVNCADIEITPRGATEGQGHEHGHVRGHGHANSVSGDILIRRRVTSPLTTMSPVTSSIGLNESFVTSKTSGTGRLLGQDTTLRHTQSVQPKDGSAPAVEVTAITPSSTPSIANQTGAIGAVQHRQPQSVVGENQTTVAQETVSQFEETTVSMVTETPAQPLTISTQSPTESQLSQSSEISRSAIPTQMSHVTTQSTIAPVSVTSGVTQSTIKRQVLTLDDIRQEIVKTLGSDVSNGVRLLFNPPTEHPTGQSQDTTPAHTQTSITGPPHFQQTFFPAFDRVTEKPKQTDLPNTQFVSVSNILDRFYPNYMSPLLFTLTRTRNFGLKLPQGCDVNSDEFRCKARGIYNHSPGISRWCEINCRAANCVPFMCECGCDEKQLKNSSCHAIAEFQGVEGMDEWCTANCKVGYCPANTCNSDCLRPFVAK